jgi:DNA-binding transcriptional ArsR family regulator
VGASPLSAASLSPDARAVLAALAREESLTAEDLVAAADLSAATVLAALFELEGAGLAVEDSGRYSARGR